MKDKKLSKKELEMYIEGMEELLSDADMVFMDLEEAQKEYKKRFGKEYEF